GNGNWYGAAGMGGGKNAGTIYRMTYAGGHWKYTRLYTFCAGKTCADGNGPHGALVLDTAGNLYGTTTNGGKADKGTVFELSPNGSGWTLTQLHDFCAVKDCKDGATPYQVALAYQGQASGVLYDG